MSGMNITAIETSEPIQPILKLVELNRVSAEVPAGLRAAAEECSSRRIRRAFLRLADHVEAGGTPAGFKSCDLEALVAAAAVEHYPGESNPNGYHLYDAPPEALTDVSSSLDSVSIAPRLARWIEGDRELRTAVRQIEVHLWLAVLLFFIGGFANWLMFQLVHGPVLDMLREYEFDIDAATLTFFNLVAWTGPVVMGFATAMSLVLVMYRLGPMRESVERCIYTIPYLGVALRRLHFAVLCENVARLLAAGFTYPDALNSAKAIVRPHTLKHWLTHAALAVEDGGKLLDTLDYLPAGGEILPAMVGPVGPSPQSPWVGWGHAASYFRVSGIRGAATAKLVVPVFSLIATMLGWMGITAVFAPIVAIISSLGGL